jgi:hypothetical protein
MKKGMSKKGCPLTQKDAALMGRLCDFRDWNRITRKHDVLDMVPAALYKKAWYMGFKAGFLFKKRNKSEGK